MRPRSSRTHALVWGSLTLAVLSCAIAAVTGVGDRDGAGQGRRFIDHATIQFTGRLDAAITIKGRGSNVHAARLDALQQLAEFDAKEGKLAEVRIVTVGRTLRAAGHWHYWWHNAGQEPHWRECGAITPELPVSPFGRKLIVTETLNTCVLTIHPEPTRADLFWDPSGEVDSPKVRHPEGLPLPGQAAED